MKGYSINKQSSYRVVDVLTTDIWSMSYEMGAHIEKVEKKCFTIRSVSQSTTIRRCKRLCDMRIICNFYVQPHGSLKILPNPGKGSESGTVNSGAVNLFWCDPSH